MMNLIALLTTTVLSFLTNVNTLQAPRLDGKIVGGKPADISDYPHQLALLIYDQYSCGASIISAEWAVTAAHCIQRVDIQIVSLRSGSTNYQEGGTIYKVDKKITHNLYNHHTMDYDIALMRVKTPFVFGPGVGAIRLPKYKQETAVGTIVSVTGWGLLSDGGSIPSCTLQVVELPIMSRAACRADYFWMKITARMICAGYPSGGKDACKGDSGGPMVANNQLIGIVSWGIGCARPNRPGVYTNVSTMIRWITEKVNEG